MGGHATYIPLDELDQINSPTFVFLWQAWKVLEGQKDDFGHHCKISYVAFRSQSPTCFARRIAKDHFAIAISDALITLTVHFSCHLSSIKEVREFLKVQDGNYLTTAGGDVKDVWDLDQNLVVQNLFISSPIWKYAFVFIIVHELSHITNGHLDFLEKKDSKYLSQQEVSLTRKCLEADADCAAAGALTGIIIKYFNDIPDFDKEDLQSVGDVITLILSSVFQENNLDDLFDDDLPKKGTYHPVDLARYYYCLASYQTWMSLTYPLEFEKTLKNKSASNIQYTVNSLFFSRSKDKELLKEKWKSKSEFFEYWKKIQIMLKPLKSDGMKFVTPLTLSSERNLTSRQITRGPTIESNYGDRCDNPQIAIA